VRWRSYFNRSWQRSFKRQFDTWSRYKTGPANQLRRLHAYYISRTAGRANRKQYLWSRGWRAFSRESATYG